MLVSKEVGRLFPRESMSSKLPPTSVWVIFLFVLQLYYGDEQRAAEGGETAPDDQGWWRQTRDVISAFPWQRGSGHMSGRTGARWHQSTLGSQTGLHRHLQGDTQDWGVSQSEASWGSRGLRQSSHSRGGKRWPFWHHGIPDFQRSQCEHSRVWRPDSPPRSLPVWQHWHCQVLGPEWCWRERFGHQKAEPFTNQHPERSRWVHQILTQERCWCPHSWLRWTVSFALRCRMGQHGNCNDASVHGGHGKPARQRREDISAFSNWWWYLWLSQGEWWRWGN